MEDFNAKCQEVESDYKDLTQEEKKLKKERNEGN